MATPRPVHPTARALFDALDQQQQQDGSQTYKSLKQQSTFIQKQSQSLGWRNRHSQASEYPIVMQSHAFTVHQVQRGEVDGTYGTGATVWPASMVLLKYLERHPHLIQNKTVVDLGAGTGVTSLAAALLGCRHVVCTDGCDHVVRLAQENISRACQMIDGIESQVNVKRYMWGDGSLQEKFHVILVSDCVLPKLYPIAPLVDAIDELATEDSVAILSYEHRFYASYDPRVKFRELATIRGLEVQIIPLSEQDPVYSVDDIELWRVTRTKV